MSTVNPQLYALAAKVLARWEDEVRRFAPDEHLRWQQLLQQLPAHCDAHQLRDALAPLIAKNRQEQDLFYTFFEAESAEIPEEKPLIQAPTNGFWARYAPFLLLAGLGALIAGMYFSPPHPAALPATPLRLYLTVAAGAAKEVCPDSTTLLQMGTIQSARFTETDADTLRRPLGRLALSTAGCITLQANPDSAGTDSVRYQLQSARGSRAVDVIIDVVQVSGTGETVLTKTTLPTADTLLPYPMPYNHDPLVRAMALGNEGFWVKYAWLWKLGTWLLFAVLLVFFLWWRAWHRKKYVARRNENARPPYVWNIRIPGMAPPDPGDAFQSTLQALRRRTEDEARVPDLPASVRAAARKAGLATLLYKKLSRPSEYLLLVDRHDHRDHRARLYDDLYRTLRNNEVLVERFFFENDLRLCFNEAHPEGIGIEELLFRYPQHRLLVVSAGRGLFSGSTGRLMKWTETLERWKQRALLSPLPPGQWRRREDQLARLFQFAPATMLGLGRVITAFETDDADTGAPDLAKMAALGGGDTIQLDAEGDLLQTLRTALPDETTRNWLACCALWPELHYDLTLWIGNWLEQESGVPVTSFERLSELLRLPWFSQGAMPDAARVLLLNELRATEPTLEPRLRNALHQLLRAQGPPTDSAAWDDFALRIAFNEWMIATDPKLKKALAERIAQYIDATGRTDFIMVQELKGPPGPLDNLLPDNLKKRFFKGGIPAIGLRDLWKDRIWALVALLCAGLALGLWSVEAGKCKGETAEVPLAKDTVIACCIDDYRKIQLFYEYRMRAAAAKDDGAQADTLKPESGLPLGWFNALVQQAQSDTAAMRITREGRANMANALYLAGLPAYRVAENLRKSQKGYDPDTSRLHESACAWFARAARWDSTLYQVRAAQTWCAAPGIVLPADTTQGLTSLVAVVVPGTKPDTTKIPLPDLVPIPGGTYLRGCADEKDPDCGDDEKPVREVKINAFSMGRTEVTNAQYCAFLNAMGNREDGGVTWIDLEEEFQDEHCRIKQKGKKFEVEKGYEQHPVIYVSWYGAKAYCDWLSSKVNGRKYRLPTEAEWEYAARGGNKPGGYKYAGSDDLDAVGWYSGNSGDKIHPVGQKKGNELGLMDMSGNLWEWCSDWFSDSYYADGPVDNPQGPVDGAARVSRGGSWFNTPQFCRVSNRDYWRPGNRDNRLGFRVAVSSQ
ncbi:MAG: formylglycine-generating enzyme family protein [Saprospiraceae bacterium]|nr:formylglycine-generating enzyme family protein [Saprospiraceae bacterium]